MNRFYTCFVALLPMLAMVFGVNFTTDSAFAQRTSTPYLGPVPRIASGFGADGSFRVRVDVIPSPLFRGQSVTVFSPDDTNSGTGAVQPRPTIFFAHGFGAVSVDFYRDLMEHLASRGYVAVYSPYQSLEGGLDFTLRYNTLWEGFLAAARAFPTLIDTSRVGFAGHSYGAGALPAMAWRACVERGWGARGRFMFPMAPWYSDAITNEQLRRFPADMKLLMQIYNDDATNDHRMAVEIFNTIAIPPSEKDFVNILTDTVTAASAGGTQTAQTNYLYAANHGVSASRTMGGGGGIFDAYDVYGIFRPLDALAEYAFTGSAEAKRVALGGGSAEQVFMGVVPASVGGERAGTPLKPMRVTKTPGSPRLPNEQQRAQWLCNTTFNPRREFCGTLAASMPTSVQVLPQTASQAAFSERDPVSLHVAPSLVSDEAQITVCLPKPAFVRLALYNALGECVATVMDGSFQAGTHERPFSTAFGKNVRATAPNIPNGTYFLHLQTDVDVDAGTSVRSVAVRVVR